MTLIRASRIRCRARRIPSSTRQRTSPLAHVPKHQALRYARSVNASSNSSISMMPRSSATAKSLPSSSTLARTRTRQKQSGTLWMPCTRWMLISTDDAQRWDHGRTAEASQPASGMTKTSRPRRRWFERCERILERKVLSPQVDTPKIDPAELLAKPSVQRKEGWKPLTKNTQYGQILLSKRLLRLCKNKMSTADISSNTLPKCWTQYKNALETPEHLRTSVFPPQLVVASDATQAVINPDKLAHIPNN